MNPTDEFILDALKEQGVATDELVAEIRTSVEASEEAPDSDADLLLMNELLARTGLAEEEVANYLSGELSMKAVDLSAQHWFCTCCANI